MTYVLNNTAVLPASEVVASAGSSLLQRVYAAMMESRRRSAARELRARSFLINEAEMVLGGFPQTALGSENRLPFNR